MDNTTTTPTEEELIEQDLDRYFDEHVFCWRDNPKCSCQQNFNTSNNAYDNLVEEREQLLR